MGAAGEEQKVLKTEEVEEALKTWEAGAEEPTVRFQVKEEGGREMLGAVARVQMVSWKLEGVWEASFLREVEVLVLNSSLVTSMSKRVGDCFSMQQYQVQAVVVRQGWAARLHQVALELGVLL
jgi:hypothetical protein